MPAKRRQTDADLVDMDQLARVLARMNTRDSFKPPTFRGEGDVELFISQFNDVAEANEWTARQTVLHLRTQLEGPAVDCGRGESVEAILTALRVRFGISERQGKERLMSLRKKAQDSMYDHAVEIKRLVEVAFPTLRAIDRDQLALDYFHRSIDNKAYQRHILALNLRTMEEAISAAEDFFAVGGVENTTKFSARPAGGETEGASLQMSENMAKLMATIQASTQAAQAASQAQTTLLTQVLARLATPAVPINGPPVQYNGPPVPINSSQNQTQVRPLACYGCGGPHLKRHCPQQGNERGPARQ